MKRDYGQQPKQEHDSGLAWAFLLCAVLAIVVLWILPAAK